MSPGISNTKTGLFGSSPSEVSSLSKIPTQSMFIAPNDQNASSFIGDVYWQASRNLVSHISAFPGFVQSAADEFYMRFASSVGGLSQASGWVYTCNGTLANSTAGPRFGGIKSFSARVAPLYATISPSNADPTFFFGLAKNSGDAGGLNTSLGLINANGAQTDTGWRLNSSGIGYAGFVYRKQQSANWLLAVGDGAGNATLTDSGVAVNTASTALLQFTYNGNTLKFYINGVFIGGITTTLPSNNMPMSLWAGVCVVTATGTNTQVIVGFSYMSAQFL